MDKALAVEPFGHARLAHQRDKSMLQHAGANPAQDMGARAPLEDDGVYSPKVQELTKEQPGRAPANNADLCAHLVLPEFCIGST